MEANDVGPAGDEPARCAAALNVRAAVVQVPFAPHFQEQVAGPSSPHLNFHAGNGAGASRDQQIAEAPLEMPRQRSLGHLDDLAAEGVGFKKREQHGQPALLDQTDIGEGGSYIGSVWPRRVPIAAGVCGRVRRWWGSSGALQHPLARHP
jgi:hypothetical protein